MHEIQNIITERVDDIPLWLEHMERMGRPALFDAHFPTHGTWHGLSFGWVATIWLSAIFSRGDPRLVHVEPWVNQRLWTRRTATGQAVERLDFTDDRLARVRRGLHDDTRWSAFEAALNQHTVRVYELSTERMHVDSPSASAYTTVTDEGLWQFGHSQDHRPDLPQVTVMQAVLDPLGRPLATEVVSGERAEDPLSVPCIKRVPASLGRHGLLSVGDCKMAAGEPRAFLASQGDFSLCPLPQVQLAEDELHEALEAIWSGAHALSPGVRERQAGKPALLAEGSERQGPLCLEVEGKLQSWTERRLVVRSMRQAQAAEAALRTRMAKAKAQVEALHQRGRGKKCFAEIEP